MYEFKANDPLITEEENKIKTSSEDSIEFSDKQDECHLRFIARYYKT